MVPEPTSPALETHLAVLPTFGFDVDDGPGFGVRSELTRVGKDYEPFKAAFIIQGYVSLNGYQHHRFRMDLPGLGRKEDQRVTLHVAYRRWLNNGYWGIGNGTTRDATLEELEDPDDPLQKYYRYDLVQPFSHLTWRKTLSGPWLVFGALDFKWSQINPYPGSLLEAQQPTGMEGGPEATVSTGILFDTRTPEITPDHGFLGEVSGRAAAGSGSFVGGFASLRAYFSLSERVVFASRAMGEYLFGDIPFYEMVMWGGLIPTNGMGGGETIRGISFGRFHAPGKAVWDNELRVDVTETTLFKRPVRWLFVPFADVGTVFGAFDLATAPWPEENLFHPGVGGGVHVVYDETLVGRLDVAAGFDPLRYPSGEVDAAPTLGVYLLFDHMF